MTSPPSSLASLLAFPPATQPPNDHGGPQADEENQAAFLTCELADCFEDVALATRRRIGLILNSRLDLRENYAGREGEVDPARYPHPPSEWQSSPSPCFSARRG